MDVALQIDAVYQRASLLRQRSQESIANPHLLDDSLQDLHLVLEELQTSQEELRHQNQALLVAQQTVEQQRQRYLTLYELAPDGYLATDRQGNIRQANRAAARLFSIPQEYLVGKPLMVLIHETDRALFQARLTTLEQEAHWELLLSSRNGSSRTVEIVATRLSKESEESELLWTFRDITQRKQAETEVRQLNASLEARVVQRTEELETQNSRNELLLRQDQQTQAELQAAIGQLERINRQNEELLEREQEARAEAEAASAETATYAERLTLALEAALMGTWDYDLTTEQMLWDPRQEIIFGYDPGCPNRDRRDWENRVHSKDMEQVYLATCAARDSRQSLAIQYRIIWPDGSLHWIDAKGRFCYDAAGKPVRMIGVARDITAAKQNEQALLESEARYRSVVEATSKIIWNTNAVGELCTQQYGWSQFTGQSLEEYQGWGWLDAVHTDDRQPTAQAWSRAVADGTPHRIEQRLRRSDGEYRQMLVRAVPVLEQSGSVREWVGTHTDITERKEAQAALEERARELSNLNVLLAQAATMLDKKNKELDSFVHIVSHDLKAPLRAIANLSQWIEDDLNESLPAHSRQQITLLRSRVSRMENMIVSLLNYARVGQTDAEIKTVSVEELLSEVIDSLAPPPAFEITIAPNMPTLQTKRVLLFQVFSNLIGNGIKYHGRPNGSIRISVEDRGDYYEFAVADDGPGIAPEYHSKIFTIFQTAMSSRADSTGVGLSIVKKIVETEKGTIRLESKLGEGTTFYFTWPKQS
jgi:PAS domain S-box-containing protein